MSVYDLQYYLTQLANELSADNDFRQDMLNRATQYQDEFLYRKEAGATRPRTRGPQYHNRRHIDRDYQKKRLNPKKTVEALADEMESFDIPTPSYVDVDDSKNKEAWERAIDKVASQGELIYKDIPNYPALTEAYKIQLASLKGNYDLYTGRYQDVDNLLAIKSASFTQRVR